MARFLLIFSLLFCFSFGEDLPPFDLGLMSTCWANETVRCGLSFSPKIGDLDDRYMFLDSVTNVSFMTTNDDFGLNCDYYRYCYWASDQKVIQEAEYQDSSLKVFSADYYDISLASESSRFVDLIQMFEVVDESSDENAGYYVGEAQGNIAGLGFDSSFFMQVLENKYNESVVTLFVNPETIPQDFTGSVLTIGGYNSSFLEDSENTEFQLFDQAVDAFDSSLIVPTLPVMSISIGEELFETYPEFEHLEISTMDYGVFVPDAIFESFMDMWNEKRCEKRQKQNCSINAADFPTISFVIGPDREGKSFNFDIPYQFYTDQEDYSQMLGSGADSWWRRKDSFTIGLGPLSKVLVSLDYKGKIIGLAQSKGADYSISVPNEGMIWVFIGIVLGFPVAIFLVYFIYVLGVTKCFTRTLESDSIVSELMGSSVSSRKATDNNELLARLHHEEKKDDKE